jgi:hypothetical protein
LFVYLLFVSEKPKNQFIRSYVRREKFQFVWEKLLITVNQLSRRVARGEGGEKTICCLSLWKLLLVLRPKKRE